MLLTEYDEAEQMELFREDGRREGLQDGRREVRQNAASKMKADGISTETISKWLGLSEKEVLEL